MTDAALFCGNASRDGDIIPPLEDSATEGTDEAEQVPMYQPFVMPRF